MIKRLKTFLLGALCFIVSQVLLRIPILNYLQGSTDFQLFALYNGFLVGALITLSAGVFEEGFRFIFKSLFFKARNIDISQPIVFGFGHGLAEALILLGPLLRTMPLKFLLLPLIERVLAIILHIGLSVLVWNGFQLGKKYRYLFLAIMVHTLVNSLIPFFKPIENSIIIFQLIFLLIDILMIVYIYGSRKNYKTGEMNI